MDLGVGVVVAVRGSFVDVRFDARLPPVFLLLRTGSRNDVLIEVLAQGDERHVRGIALTPTQELARGMTVEDTEGPLTAPVGKGLLSRLFDVFGRPIDRGWPFTDLAFRSVHRALPALMHRPIRSQIFETGITAIAVLVPLVRGGKAGLFGGAGVGKTAPLKEMIHT